MKITICPISISKDLGVKESNKIVNTNFVIDFEENATVNHYYEGIVDDKICLLFGSIYDKQEDFIKYVRQRYKQFGSKGLFDIDGSFVYIEIDMNKGNMVVVSEREGLIPLYYRVYGNQIALTTECDRLFYDYAEGDIDYSAMYDYLRYGLLIGNNTMSTKVKLLQGGSELLIDANGMLECKKVRCFHHDSLSEVDDTRSIAKEMKSIYENAIKKRIDRKMDEMAVFLSGGMDSRFVLSAMNNISSDSGPVCYAFGQPLSEEVDIAEKVASVRDNKFNVITLLPEDHIVDAKDYVRMTCGTDMLAQSYIIAAAKKIKNKGQTAFFTGTILEAHIGGSFLPEDALDYKGKFSEYIVSKMGNVKCELFKEDELKEICNSNVYSKVFANNKGNLEFEAKKYDDWLVKDIIQSFIIDQRDKRLVLNREIVPGKYLDYINPNFDKDFLELVAKIPAKERFQRKFYREVFVANYPEYGNIVYNNTGLPISAPMTYWIQGAKLEMQKEVMFAEIQKEMNKNKHEFYYPHYYSDFDGYSRYNRKWREFFGEILFSEKSYLVGKILREDSVRKMYHDHIAGKANYRKKLLYIASLELFYQTMIRR